MHAHQRGFLRPGLAAHQGQVHGAIDMVLHADQPECTEFRFDLEIRDGFHGLFLGEPIADEIRDGADLEVMTPGEPQQIVPSCHGTVFAEDLHDHRRRFEACQPHQVAARLGMPGARQYTARLGPERKYVAGLLKVLWLRAGSDRRANRPRPVMGRDSRRDPLGRLDGQGEVGAAPPIGFADHQRQAKLLATLPSEGQADQPPAVARHEIDVGGAHPAGGHDQVALVFAGLVIQDDGHLAVAQVGDDFLDRVQTGDHGFLADGNCHEIQISSVDWGRLTPTTDQPPATVPGNARRCRLQY